MQPHPPFKFLLMGKVMYPQLPATSWDIHFKHPRRLQVGKTYGEYSKKKEEVLTKHKKITV